MSLFGWWRKKLQLVIEEDYSMYDLGGITDADPRLDDGLDSADLSAAFNALAPDMQREAIRHVREIICTDRCECGLG